MPGLNPRQDQADPKDEMVIRKPRCRMTEAKNQREQRSKQRNREHLRQPRREVGGQQL
jgi:hypothetical protein